MKKGQISLFVIVGIVVLIALFLILGILFARARDAGIKDLTQGLQELPGLGTEVKLFTTSAFEDGATCGLVEHGLRKLDIDSSSVRVTNSLVREYDAFEGLEVIPLDDMAVSHSVNADSVSFDLHSPLLIRNAESYEHVPKHQRVELDVRLKYLRDLEKTIAVQKDINLHLLEQLDMNASVLGDTYTFIDEQSSLNSVPYWYSTSSVSSRSSR